jgi:hypothetical protein
MAPINVMRVSLSPAGLAPRIVNLAEWRGHLIGRLRRQIDLTADPELIELLAEVMDYGKVTTQRRPTASPASDMVIPFRLRIGADILSFFSTTMVFGTPLEVTLSELALESFFPADAQTAAIVKRLAM